MHTSDVLIIGAGISGISAAHHLVKNNPNKSFTILEGRSDIGGTWDLFRYPGIRSDSDMYTLGFSFRPWESEKSIADAPSIMSYLRNTLAESGLGKHIRYNKKVKAAHWSSADNMWSLDVHDEKTNTQETYRARFVHLCTGYYNYENAYRPHFEGEENFNGKIVHPQFWDESMDYRDKNIVVIGSGATAVTLIPAMAEQAKHITMLQRSPTYIISAPGNNEFATRLRKFLPNKLVYAIVRWRNILYQRFMFWYCQRYPDRARNFLLGEAQKQVPEGFDMEKHLTPSYKPWDQRLCLAPDGDFFEALQSGKASIATDTISRFVEGGIELASGEKLDADVIVTATGLEVLFFGNIKVDVDGRDIKTGDLMSYKGIMFGGVPNLALSTGYTNASWTLKCDLTSTYVCRLLNYMDKHGHEKVVANADGITPELVFNLTSGYVQRAQEVMPKQGLEHPWRLNHNYLTDLLMIKYGSMRDSSIEFSSGGDMTNEKLPLAAE